MGDIYDVIVIGGGHAGCEAAAAAARMGAKTVLVTHKFSTIGAMSCNPAIGGLGKGHLVREIDALDGVMARAIDLSGIQFRILNASKGPAVRGPRAQADRKLYKAAMQSILSDYPNLTIIESGVEDLVIEENAPGAKAVRGVVLADGTSLRCGAVVITSGTFLRGVIHQGTSQTPAGRIGEAPSVGLAKALERLRLPLGRLKTGTPARLNAGTIDFSILEEQHGDTPPVPFSFLNKTITVPQIPCYITHTTAQTHEIIRDNIHVAPMYSGQIKSRGPRYCPSIEDKIMRFADKERHQIFLEPEGLDDPTIYPNGISTSLPIDIQDKFIRSIKGLGAVEVFQYGYAIEYDFCDPRDLTPGLESKSAANLFLAGQINGTTGYEEAAAQGLMAGLNAALRAGRVASITQTQNVSRETSARVDGDISGAREGQFTLDRAAAYIGVMIDDLITRGAPEPYRMFTSRAEYRLTLRADNADQRLTEVGLALGCVGRERAEAWAFKKDRLDRARALTTHLQKTPNELAQMGIEVNFDGVRRNVLDLAALPHVGWDRLRQVWPELNEIEPEIAEQIQIDSLYAGYMDRQNSDIEAFRRDEDLIIPTPFDFAQVGSLSTEIRQKLQEAQPATLGAASRIPGVTPAAVMALLRFVKKKPLAA
ncbi:MAG: tRNA uridine-5-carboxymethylaminomethyl(34) synthesis enzyme MnmG [Alphaproteobacteria bacterium]|nr:tRNA uridine-5-carboxymethylaminomethyl(34) synthesis enzyme MnmG [Alphaproteobacteria bacterium]